MSRRTFLAIIATAALLAGCSERAPQEPAALPLEPEAIPPKAAPKAISALPSYTRFGYSGLAYFKGRLYASSNIGLLEFRDRKLVALYQWQKHDPVVEGPWGDPAHDSLWIQHANTGTLTRLDGRGWHNVPLPVPERGYYTRGDVLAGFRGIGSPQRFWLIDGGYVWRWGANSGDWTSEPAPPAPRFSKTVGVAPLPAGLLYIVREGVAVLPPAPFAVYTWSGDWKRLTLGTFSFAQVVTIGDAVYVRTEEGDLLHVSPLSMEEVETPGLCKAIAMTSDGRLLASFYNKGIFVFDKTWVRLFASPYPSGEDKYLAYLAEYEGQVAYATKSVPQLIDPLGSTFNFVGTDALWISKGETLEQVTLDPR